MADNTNPDVSLASELEDDSGTPQGHESARSAAQAARELALNPRLDLRSAVDSFVQARFNNSILAEGIRGQALELLASKVDENTRPSMLLELTSVLSKQSESDLDSIVKITAPRDPNRPGMANFFFGVPEEATPVGTPSLPKETYQLLDKIVLAAEVVISNPPQPKKPAKATKKASPKKPTKKPATPATKKAAPKKPAASLVKKPTTQGVKKAAPKKSS